ncbi:MAG: PEGA domain-containing protein [Myxococcota bacterium]|nr:PEGA domain-containing protein [Myxococcota bacterium]
MNGCEKIVEIWSEEAAGVVPSDEDRAFAQCHLQQCHRCAAEAKAVSALSVAGGLDPAPALIDFERRRFIEDSVRKHREALAARQRGAKRWPALALAAAAVALLTLGSSLAWFNVGSQDPMGPSAVAKDSVPVRPDPFEARLVVVAGEVFVGGRAVTAGRLGMDDELETGRGMAVLAVAPGVLAHLSPNTGVGAIRMETKAVELGLRHGRLLLEVDPEVVEGAVAVSTREGQVTVKGTVFAVSDVAEEVAVATLRGSVDVQKGDSSVAVIAGERYSLTHAETRPLSAEEVDLARRNLSTIELSSCTSCACLEIVTNPPGASVTLDDRELGTTPIHAEVARGQYALSIALEGHDAIRERLRVQAQQPLTRSFSLVARKWSASPKRPSSSFEKAGQALEVDILVSQARAARKQGDWLLAAQTYERIIASYPDSFEARSSWVALGYVQLEHLAQPEVALVSFEEYLRRQVGGSLTQEASYGRILALYRLGQTQREKAAIEDFLRRFPTAIESQSVKERLAQLEGE